MTRQLRGVQSLKIGAAAQLLPVVAGYGTVLLTTPFVVGQLGLHDFGIWSMTGAIAQYAALLDLGVSRAASRYVALFHAKGDGTSEGAVVGICVTALTILGTLLVGLALLTPTLIGHLIRIDDPELACFLLVSAVLIMVVGLLARVLAAASIGRGRQVPASIGVAILSTMQAVGGVIGLLVQPSLATFAGGTVIGTMCGLGAVIIVILFDERRITIGKPMASLTREILTYGIHSQLAAAGGMLLLQSGKLIAGIMIGPAAAGVYELASRLAMGAQVLGASSAGALMPYLTRSHISGGMDSLKSQYEHLTRRNTAVAVLTPFAMAATAVPGVPLWLGVDNFPVTLVLLALLPGIATNVSTAVCTSMISAIGRPVLLAQATLMAGVLQTSFAVVLGYYFDSAGIAIAFAVGVPAANMASMWFLQTRLRLPMILFFRGIRGPFAVGTFALLCALPIGALMAPDTRATALWPFAASAVVFCAVYACLGWQFDYLPRLSLPSVRSHKRRPPSGRHRA
jgi:O-antigen/teichoic acid export membrane protein